MWEEMSYNKYTEDYNADMYFDFEMPFDDDTQFDCDDIDVEIIEEGY